MPCKRRGSTRRRANKKLFDDEATWCNALLQNINEFMQKNNSLQIEQDELSKFFGWYQTWRKLIRKPPQRHLERSILHYALQRLYWSECTDTKLIAAVMKNIFHTDGHFGVIFTTNCFQDESFNENLVVKKITKPLDFFLEHAYKNKMLFNGKRMASIDLYFSSWITPCQLALEKASPSMLLTLLRYGALLQPTSGVGPVTRSGVFDKSEAFLKILRVCIKTILTLNPLILPLTQVTDVLSCEEAQRLQTAVIFANLLMRVVPPFKIDRLFRQWGGKLKPRSQYMKQCALKLGCLIPVFPSRCLEPMTLKDSCKQIIRKKLHNNWALPQGIWMLNVPATLVEYLDLRMD